jgi:RNA polymerase sigma-70 factor, ECF subfamily
MDLAALFAEHHEPLFRYLARLTGDPDSAADAAQEAFIRLLEKPPAPGHTRGWLYKVATNVALEAARTRSRRLVLVRSAGDRVPVGDAPAAPDEQLARTQRRERVRHALARLNERDRAVLLLREEGFSHREIAEQVGTTTGSVGTMIARALDKLAGELDLDEEMAS